MSRSLSWRIAAGLSIMAAGALTRLILRKGWRAALHADPPVDPDAKDVRWQEALGWGLLSAAGASVARLLAQRGARRGWRALTGGDPPD